MGDAYNDQTLTVYHALRDGTAETFTVTAADGKAPVTVETLSPFLLTAVKESTQPVQSAEQVSPATGDDSHPAAALTLLAASGLGLAWREKRKKESAR